MGFSSDDQARKDLKKGREQALAQLERIYEGPLRGLQMAPEFFRLLGSDALSGTPLGRGVGLQNQLLDAVSGGLAGRSAGRLPADLRSSVTEGFGGAQAGRGTYGSPAGNLALANEFAGQSEAIRSQRIQNALAVLGGTSAGGSVFPSANAFLQVGANRASQAADLTYRSFAGEAEAAQNASNANSAALGSLFGTGLGLLTGGLAGGFGGLAGLTGYGGGQGFNLGAAAQGALGFSGLAPTSFFSGGRNPFLQNPFEQPDFLSQLFRQQVNQRGQYVADQFGSFIY